MKYGKIAALLIAAAMLGGCSPAVQDSEAQPVVRMAVISADDGFSELVQAQASGQIQINAADNAADSEMDITLLYMPEANVLSEATATDVVLTDTPDMLPEDVAAVTVDDRDVVIAAWNALYTYPAHSSPVRVLTLTESGATPSREIFESMLFEGMLQDKGSYIGSRTDISPEKWVKERLEDIPVGLLDTIYAETEELAVAAYNALRAAQRNDSVEIICPVLTDRLIALMVEDHWSMGVCVGVSMKDGAKAMLEVAEELAETGEAKSVALEPRVVYSDDVKALVDSGVTDITELMNALVN